MEINGSLATMSMPEVLQWLSLGGKTGVLSLEHKQVRKMIFFTGGRIVSAASNDPREYFGQFLLRSKLITEIELTEAFALQRERGMMLGKILVESGKLTEEQVRSHLIVKAVETILEAFLWKEGEFRFVESRLPEDDLVPISLDLTGLIAEGARRRHELFDLREWLPSTLTTFEVSWEHLPPEYEGDALVSDLVVMADDGRTLAEMCLELHESELSVFRLVKALMEHEVLRPKEAQEIEAEALSEALVAELLREGEDLMIIGRSAEAVEVLRKAAQVGGESEVSELITEATEAWKKDWSAEKLTKVPVLLHEIPRAELSPQEGFVLARATGAFSVDSISKLAPFDSDEVLRIIRKYMDRGSMRLRSPEGLWR